MLGVGISLSPRVYRDYAVAASFANTKSLDLDGTGDFFDPQLSESELQAIYRDSHTMSVWVKMAWNVSSTIWGYGDTGGGVAGSFKVNYVYINAAVDAFQTSGKMGGGSTSSGLLINLVESDDASAWVHVCISQIKGATQNDAGSYKLYLNGANVYDGTTPSKDYQEATTVSSGRGLAFGAWNNNGTVSANTTGKIDNIAIWTTGLDDDAVAAIYNSGTPIDLTSNSGNYDNSSDLQHYWKLEDDTTDTQGNSDGALVGDPVYSTEVP